MGHSPNRETAGTFDDDFVEAVNEQPPEQERPAVDEFFCR